MQAMADGYVRADESQARAAEREDEILRIADRFQVGQVLDRMPTVSLKLRCNPWAPISKIDEGGDGKVKEKCYFAPVFKDTF